MDAAIEAIATSADIACVGSSSARRTTGAAVDSVWVIPCFDCHLRDTIFGFASKCNWLQVMRTNDKYARISHRRAGTNSGFACVAIFTTVTSAPFFSSSTFCPPAELALALRADPGPDASRPGVFESEKAFAFVAEVPASETEACSEPIITPPT